jgi:adenosylhomocysteine nucleosidase
MFRDRVAGTVLLSILLLCASCSGPTGVLGSGKQEDVTLILGAFADEVKPIQAQLENKRQGKIGGIVFAEGKLRGRHVAVTWTGIGKVNAAATTALFIEHFHPSEVIVCGIAGAINPQLGVGDVIIAEKSAQHDLGFWSDAGVESRGFDNRLTGEQNPVFFAADERLLGIALRAGGQTALKGIGTDEKGVQAKVKRGVVVTGDTFIMSPQKRIDLQKRLGADAVEMEGAAIAQVCYQRGIPHLVIRGISDTADEKADKDVNTFQNIALGNAAKVTCKMVELMAVQQPAECRQNGK